MQNCQHGKSIPNSVLHDVPMNQANPGRHKCVTCAYQAGVDDTLNAMAEHMKNSIKKILEKKTKEKT